MKKILISVFLSSILTVSLSIITNAQTFSIKNDISTFGVTKDTYIYASQTNGGIGDTTYEHYGNSKYDARALVRNVGSNPFNYKIYTTTGFLVYNANLQPGEEHILGLSQSILKWDLADGKGTVKISTPDGSTGEAYFRYNVLD